MEEVYKMLKEDEFKRKEIVQPGEIETMVVDEAEWPFEEDSLCLIMNNLTLHWQNNIEASFAGFHKSLRPNGAYIGSMLGGDTLQELRISMNLAEQEREGGMGAAISPMLSLAEAGNIFARAKYNLPTADKTDCYVEFEDTL